MTSNFEQSVIIKFLIFFTHECKYFKFRHKVILGNIEIYEKLCIREVNIYYVHVSPFSVVFDFRLLSSSI